MLPESMWSINIFSKLSALFMKTVSFLKSMWASDVFAAKICAGGTSSAQSEPVYAGTQGWPLREAFQHFPERKRGRKGCKRMPKFPCCFFWKLAPPLLSSYFNTTSTHLERLCTSCNSVSWPKSLSTVFSQRYVSDIQSPLVCKPTLTGFALWSKISL